MLYFLYFNFKSIRNIIRKSKDLKGLKFISSILRFGNCMDNNLLLPVLYIEKKIFFKINYKTIDNKPKTRVTFHTYS